MTFACHDGAPSDRVHFYLYPSATAFDPSQALFTGLPRMVTAADTFKSSARSYVATRLPIMMVLPGAFSSLRLPITAGNNALTTLSCCTMMFADRQFGVSSPQARGRPREAADRLVGRPRPRREWRQIAARQGLGDFMASRNFTLDWLLSPLYRVHAQRLLKGARARRCFGAFFLAKETS